MSLSQCLAFTGSTTHTNLSRQRTGGVGIAVTAALGADL
jgi:hypothetical protein